ncbi:MAG: curlin [Hyphomicrobiales bacterium]|nr:MAG: curlin [Hyphomicrobiales bacterium]
MKRTSIKSAIAALAIATAIALPSVPAYAGGSFSITVKPASEDAENAMKLGMLFYAIAQNAKKGGHITQKGHNNSAGVAQNGSGNFGIVHQEGDNHNGSVTQNGNNNAHALFQFGKNTDGHVAQNGNDETGATFQFGW